MTLTGRLPNAGVPFYVFTSINFYAIIICNSMWFFMKYGSLFTKAGDPLYKRLLSLLVVLCLLGMPGCFCTAESSAQEPLRVALLNYPGYSDIDAYGQPVGLAIDYLNALAAYTGWTYEYVSLTLDQAREQLLDGRIDLIPGRSHSFSAEALYADKTMGAAICVLVCRADDDRYAYQDYEAFSGMKVGVLTGSHYIEDVHLAEETLGFKLDTVYYDTHDDCMTALSNGDVDALLMLSIRRDEGTKDIARFGSTDLYMAVTPTRPDLLAKLNAAHEQLYVDDPFHMLTLYEHYFGDVMVSLNLTRTEIDYLADLPPLNIGILNTMPVYAHSSTSGDIQGILPDLLQQIADKLGIELRFHTSESIPALLSGLDSGAYDLILPLHSTDDVTYDSSIQLLPLLSASLGMAMPQQKDLTSFSGITVTVAGDSAVLKEIVAASLPEDVTCSYGVPPAQSLQLLLDGWADAVIGTRLSLQKLLESPLYDGLTLHPVYTVDYQLSIGLPADASPLLVSALKKAIATLNRQDADNATLRHTVGAPVQITLRDLVYRYRQQIGLFLLLLALVICLIVITTGSTRKYRQRMADSKAALEREIEQRRQLEAQRESDRRHHEELRFLATHDTLTGLYNLNGFDIATRRLWENHPEMSFKIVRMEINSFKIYNDLFGSEAGQKVIKAIARRFQSMATDIMTYARLTNDHFVVCIPAEVDVDLLLQQETIWLQEQYGGHDLIPCMGDYFVTDKEQSITIMCDRALAAIETVRGLYPPRVGHYTEELRQELLTEQWITANMRQALLRGEFVPFFQPQYRLYTGQITGAEVLVRWISRERGFIGPGQFIPIFEKNGFISEMDLYIWEESCRWLRKWLDDGNPPIALSINASRLDVRNLDLARVLPEMVHRYQLPPSLIRLEITESAYSQDPEQFIHTVSALQRTGFTIEMDDFGSGYSSLNVLKDVPVDVLKLDMLFLSAGDEFGRSASIIRSVVNMSKWLNLTVIAEGVETAQQSDFLKSVGCTQAQGYRYSKPICATDFEALLHRSSISITDERSTPASDIHPERNLMPPDRQLIMLMVADEARCSDLRRILGNEYDFIEAASGDLALTYLQSGMTPDCILLDSELPGMADYDLLHRLRSTPEARNLLILTILPIDAGEHEALAHGTSDFLYRPFSPEVVQHRVRSQLMLQHAIHQAQIDGLTGLLNRTTFFRLVDTALQTREGSPAQGVFMTLDLDSFKNLNDLYGHPFGDQVLAAFADMLMSVCGRQAILGRLGGDEFGVLIPDAGSRTEMAALAARILEQARRIVLDGKAELVSCSLGASVYPVDFVHRVDLYSAADQALYAAKDREGLHMAFYDELEH